MAKESFIKRHSYILIGVAILGAIAIHGHNKKNTEYRPQNIPKPAITEQVQKKGTNVIVPSKAAPLLKDNKPVVCNFYNGYHDIYIYTYGSPIFKAVQQKRGKALYRALKNNPKPRESAVG